MGISIRAYGRHRGVSEAAVRKAIKTGRIGLETDGTIDIAKADKDWQDNTTSRKFLPPSEETTFMQAKTVNEVLKTETNKLKLSQLKGELVNKAEVLAHVYKLARIERDAWLNWPARISAVIATELKVDSHLMHITLEQYVRKHLSELGEFKL